MAAYNSSPLIEMDRCELDDQTVMSQYRSGYSYFKVTSIFGTDKTFPDILGRIIQLKLQSKD
jgi:hypothetical protein